MSSFFSYAISLRIAWDLRAGEEKVPAASVGTGHARDTPGDRGSSHGHLAGIRLLWMLEYGFH